MVDPHIKVNIPKISFKDVAGMREAKQEVMEFVEYMKSPQKFAVSVDRCRFIDETIELLDEYV